MMSHLSVASAPFPSITRTSEDDAYFTSQPTLTVPESFLRPSRSRSNSVHPKEYGASSLPASPTSTAFPQRPGFHRAATSSAVTSVSTAESTRFDDLHYSQTHFSRSTLLVYSESESAAVQASSGPGPEEDIRELLLASSDEESSAPPSTPGFDSARIPPRGSSSLRVGNKQSMESEKSTLSLPEPVTLLTQQATAQNTQLRRNGSSASSQGSFKRRSRILMKIIPFARESISPPKPAAEQGHRFGTFPRTRAKQHDEPIEVLAERFSDLNSGALSPPLSSSSIKSTFSSGNALSTPATSPELGHPELPLGPLEESEWEKILEEAASRASWHSSINHRPRQHTSSNVSSHKRTIPANQLTWPRTISNPVHLSNSLLLEHVFVDISDDGRSESSYSGFPDNSWSRQTSVAESNASLQSRSAYASHLEKPDIGGPGRFGTLPRIKNRRPSTTGTSFRGEPVMFQLKPPGAPQREVVLGTASLGRATSLRQRVVPDAASVFQMRRRRSSGLGLNDSLCNVGVTRTLPTIHQGHSRETSLADSAIDNNVHTDRDKGVAMSWLGVDPYSQDPMDAFPRGYSVGGRHDSFASDTSGEFVPLRFYNRRESQDDLALLNIRRRSSNNSATVETEAAMPAFNLQPFSTSTSKRQVLARSFSTKEVSIRHYADVPEAVTASEAEAEDDDLLDGWCRRRSTFSSIIDPAFPS
ncbi:uncharacterized protein MEPE_05822 [Melanopsichium pennsylvanicum]|uniref:Uncharacterized protein n=1 Tax=Melanopsichium pennsylvanicum TaxID=63383 RepID=A0AAJ4XRN0_9BASI|nr:uncharacterized protein MEPE_05822 [Melanopsichium pennsylvanicum]